MTEPNERYQQDHPFASHGVAVGRRFLPPSSPSGGDGSGRGTVSTAAARALAARPLAALILAALVIPAFVACKGGTSLGNKNDQPVDAAVTADASTLPDGSSTLPDGSSTLPDGSLVIDNDDDGYPAEQDCDDNDPNVYPGTTRPCSTVCDTGVETCLITATWSECSASTDCTCATPGQTRVISCGYCGQKGQICGADLVWADQGDCINQGPCSPGQQDHVTCEYCGTGARLCQADCQWGPADCTGVCTPGTGEITSAGCANPWEIQDRLCDDQCQWTAVIPCTGDCWIPTREDSGFFNEDVCIPGSEFVMGREPGTAFGVDEPARTVALNPFIIDKHEVTNNRYRQCVLAGVCTTPSGNAYYHYPNRPVATVTYQMARTFCAWDGGRTLPTEAQWEKAARGPYPRVVLNPWGDDPATCDHVGGTSCHGDPLFGNHSDNVGTHPLGASYYGIQDMANNVREWCLDWYEPTYYTTGPYLNPTGPTIGTERVVRGFSYGAQPALYTDSVTRRLSVLPTQTSNYIGFRCARAGR